ncbi:MAG: hypothetical protein A2Y33_04050 [Spirochaetes bacterium GWF1_51_8]|nr:MAG: hypothetical protein A2Y33_04050 [Spirochaetes bacterium GWF1_51_8]
MRFGRTGAILLFGLIAGCGTSVNETIPEYREDYSLLTLPAVTNVPFEVVSQSKGNPPVWIYYSWVLGKDGNDNKVLFVTVYSKSATPLTDSLTKTPDETAQIKKAVESFTYDKLNESKTNVKIDEAKLKPHFDKWLAALTEQIAGGYAVNVENYWEKLRVAGQGSAGEFYRIFKRYMIDYSFYYKTALKIWDETAAKLPADLKSSGTALVQSAFLPK